MFNGLTLGIGCGDALAIGQTYGIMDYDKDNKESQHSRNRCVPGFTASGTLCAAERAVGHYTEDNERWLNIFKLNGLQAVEHGMSTGTRGGANNVPDLDTCNGVFPCEDRFHRFYVKNADSRGRIYHKNILQVICQARKEGDRSGEYSYASGVVPVPGLTLPGGAPAREWQMKASLSGWLQAFGRTDEDGELFLTVDDARAMFMEGRYPDGWQTRPWGCLVTKCTGTSSFARMSFLDVIHQYVPCDVGGNDDLCMTQIVMCRLVPRAKYHAMVVPHASMVSACAHEAKMVWECAPRMGRVWHVLKFAFIMVRNAFPRCLLTTHMLLAITPMPLSLYNDIQCLFF